MSTATPAKLETLTICHRAATIPQKWVGKEIAVGGYSSGSSTHLSRLAPGWYARYDHSHSAAALFAAPRLLQGIGEGITHVRMQQYRKVLSHVAVGRQHRELPTLREVMPSQAASLSDTDRALAPGCDFMVPPALSFRRTVLAHYASCHLPVDFLEYAVAAIDAGVLAENEVVDMLHEDRLIAGALELGIYPLEFFVSAVKSLEAISRRFIARADSRLASYGADQARALSSCVERAGSYLVLAELERRFGTNVPIGTTAWIVCITDNGGGYVPGRAE